MAERERLHELDWLRVIAIVLLLYFHTGMIFVSWHWHIKDPVSADSGLLEYLMLWLHRWRMPLLLFVSGAGTWFALGYRSSSRFLGERIRRLLIPLAFGMLVVVPPQIYFERISQYESYWAFYPTILGGVPYPQGNTSWHHLWFIAYLFCYSVLALPVFVWWRSQRSRSVREWVASVLTRPHGLLWFLVPSFLGEVVLRRFWPDDRHSLVGDWACFTYYLWFFLAGFLCCSDRRIWDAVAQRRRFHLVLGTLGLVPTYAGYLTGPHAPLTLGDVALGGSKILVAWCFVFAIVGYGKRYLSIPSRLLQEANRGIYPFYILHQTAIVAVGYYTIQLPVGMWTKFWLVSTLAGLASAATYWFLIRPWRVVGWLFGLKTGRRPVRPTAATHPSAPARVGGDM